VLEKFFKLVKVFMLIAGVGVGIVGTILLLAYLPIPHFEWNTPEMYGTVVDVDGNLVKNAVISVQGAKNKVQISKTDDFGHYLIEPNKSFHFFMATQVKSPECRSKVDVTHSEYESLHIDVVANGKVICEDAKVEQNFTLSRKNTKSE
jgi:hypothetical protein